MGDESYRYSYEQYIQNYAMAAQGYPVPEPPPAPPPAADDGARSSYDSSRRGGGYGGDDGSYNSRFSDRGGGGGQRGGGRYNESSSGGGGGYNNRRDDNDSYGSSRSSGGATANFAESVSKDFDVQRDTIFVQNLPKNVTTDDLKDSFGSIGIIKNDKKTGQPKIWIYKDKSNGEGKGEATVTYDDEAAAEAAINWFNGE